MARVYNWQIGREMSYWYPESRPKRQWAAVFDINKCIACQSCTIACKSTWTWGKGQEFMLWNNVESKPYGYYPLAWDVKLLEGLGPRDVVIASWGVLLRDSEQLSRNFLLKGFESRFKRRDGLAHALGHGAEPTSRRDELGSERAPRPERN